MDLQAYFDHHSHGASRSESAKIDRKDLKLAKQIVDGSQGFKQIQIVDSYCMARGNEAWAIIPDLLRIGHDIDPIECTHYQPPDPILNDLPESLQSYRNDQNRAFAKTLLSLCDPGLRAKLLARHEHGASKIEYKAAETDGCALYWTLLQLYHPLSRSHRRTLEKELYSFPHKFAQGNPKTTLEAMLLKHQEAMDVSLKLRWDDIGIPLIDVLSSRDPLFAVELSCYRNVPDDPDDSAVVLDEMLGKVDNVIKILDTARKDWEVRSAKSAKASESKLDALMKEMLAMKKAMSATDNRPHDKRTPNPLSDSHDKPGYCQVVKCKNKVQGFTQQNNWKICGTCLLKVRSTNAPVNLRNGSTWGTARVACELLIARLNKGCEPKNCPDKVALKVQVSQLKSDPKATSRARRNAAKKAGAQKKRARVDEDSDDHSDDEGVAKAVHTSDHVGPSEKLFAKLTAKRSKLAKLPSDRRGPH